MHMMACTKTAKPINVKFRTTLGPWKSITRCSIMMSSQFQDGGWPLIWKSLCWHISVNKKAQLMLTYLRDAKACKNCSNSTCFVSFPECHFPKFQITDA